MPANPALTTLINRTVYSRSGLPVIVETISSAISDGFPIVGYWRGSGKRCCWKRNGMFMATNMPHSSDLMLPPDLRPAAPTLAPVTHPRIKVGARFKTRSGGYVRITRISTTNEMYPLKGLWERGSTITVEQSWTMKGTYGMNAGSPSDLMLDEKIMFCILQPKTPYKVMPV